MTEAKLLEIQNRIASKVTAEVMEDVLLLTEEIRRVHEYDWMRKQKDKAEYDRIVREEGPDSPRRLRYMNWK